MIISPSIRVAALAFAGAATLHAMCPTSAAERGNPVQRFQLERFVIGGSGGWDFLTFDSVGNRLFVTRGERVQVWDVATHAVAGEIVDTPGVHGVALAYELNRGFTSNGRANSVSVFRLDDLKTLATIAIAGENPDAILYAPVVKRVYTFNGRSHDVTVIDAVSLAVLATVPLSGKPEVAVTDDAGHVFVNIEDTNEVVVIDTSSNQIEARWTLKPCEEPTGLAIDVRHKRLFSVCANHKMVVVDTGSGRVLTELPIGSEPDGVEFDPSSGLAFSANGEGSLTVVHEVDADHFETIATVATQPHARTLALDPKSHRLYLVTASFGPTPASTQAQPHPRPPMLKDTFSLLVVAPE